MQWIDGHLQYHPASGIWSSTPTICMSFYLSIDPNKGIGEPRIWIWTFTCFQLKGNEKSLKEEPLGAIWILQEANIEDNGEIKWTLDLCIKWMDGQSCQDNLPGNCLISGGSKLPYFFCPSYVAASAKITTNLEWLLPRNNLH